MKAFGTSYPIHQFLWCSVRTWKWLGNSCNLTPIVPAGNPILLAYNSISSWRIVVWVVCPQTSGKHSSKVEETIYGGLSIGSPQLRQCQVLDCFRWHSSIIANVNIHGSRHVIGCHNPKWTLIMASELCIASQILNISISWRKSKFSAWIHWIGGNFKLHQSGCIALPLVKLEKLRAYIAQMIRSLVHQRRHWRSWSGYQIEWPRFFFSCDVGFQYYTKTFCKFLPVISALTQATGVQSWLVWTMIRNLKPAHRQALASLWTALYWKFTTRMVPPWRISTIFTYLNDAHGSVFAICSLQRDYYHRTPYIFYICFSLVAVTLPGEMSPTETALDWRMRSWCICSWRYLRWIHSFPF